ncbi:MmgE/PrpD family protein [Paraburkholderia strydomiana]|uniref:MmgE/PrpD family protein n=1 Tax=Paraburkholderia strydomiana TaxID=1245417 RepID=UPI001BE8F47D|nr:MmgE/PrpD family protein [Paraburkholderia strydomiana]MBT2790054.1 MmgE/PrpD family protein [Paraburkholderia strydomiana]
MLRRRFLMSAGALLTGTSCFLPSISKADTPPNLAQRLAAYAQSLRFEDLDEETIELAKTHLSDALGCGVAALRERPVEIARKVALAASGGQSASTVLGTRSRTGADMATFANGAAIRYYDLNDVYAGKEIGHPSDNIAACLAQAEAQGASGRELIVAIVLAYEIDCRLMDATSISQRGWDHPNFSLPAAALAAGKLMKLDNAALTQAVNLAINGHVALNQTRVQTISDWKGFADAEAARNGVFAATLAREGLSGPSPIFEGDAGFFAQLSGRFEIDAAMFGGRGRPFRIRDCSVKFYPAQALTQTAIKAGIDVARQAGGVDRITAVEIRTSHEGWSSAGKDAEKWAPETSGTADHSLPYVTARAMIDGDISVASYSKVALHEAKLRGLIKKIKVIDDPEMSKLYPRYYATVVSATRDDGKVFTTRVDDIAGSATRRMQRADFVAKFKKNVVPVLGVSSADEALDMLWGLELQSSVSEIFVPLTLTS